MNNTNNDTNVNVNVNVDIDEENGSTLSIRIPGSFKKAADILGKKYDISPSEVLRICIFYGLSNEEDMKKYYLPLAIAVTSYAHLLIDDAIQATGILKFVYCDTDSVHTVGELPADMIDNKQLGKFKLEAIEEKSKYVRQKCYLTYEDNNINITCAGMPKNMKDKAVQMYGMTLFDIFTTGFEMDGKLIPKRVPGGTVLYETTFKIK